MRCCNRGQHCSRQAYPLIMTSLPRAAGLKFLRKHVLLVLLKEKAWHLGVTLHKSQQASTVLLPWMVLFLRGKSTSFSVLQPPTVDPADTHSRPVSSAAPWQTVQLSAQMQPPPDLPAGRCAVAGAMEFPQTVPGNPVTMQRPQQYSNHTSLLTATWQAAGQSPLLLFWLSLAFKPLCASSAAHGTVCKTQLTQDSWLTKLVLGTAAPCQQKRQDQQQCAVWGHAAETSDLLMDGLPT